jgi:hypothetical protein
MGTQGLRPGPGNQMSPACNTLTAMAQSHVMSALKRKKA